jgi:thiamine-monophosphate kinase
MAVDEFETIRALFAPWARSQSARALLDDAAVLEAQGALVITTDAIVEGVHFLPGDPIETIAMKALRVNISDLVGKGAKPIAALLTLIWPDVRPAGEIAAFARSFGRDLEHYGVALIGGDTTSTPGPLTISVTALGAPLGERTPSRADAKIGEDVWLAGGEIGSAWMGLQLRSGRMTLDALQRGRAEAPGLSMPPADQPMPAYLTLPGEAFDAEAGWLMTTYLAPFVRAECAAIVARFAGASMDVSDGLVADAGKLAAASGVKLRIEANAIPFSIPAERWLHTGGDVRKLIAGGDDYVVLFTAAPGARASIAAADPDGGLRLTCIGRVEAGEGVEIVDRAGAAIRFEQTGFAHKLGH